MKTPSLGVVITAPLNIHSLSLPKSISGVLVRADLAPESFFEAESNHSDVISIYALNSTFTGGQSKLTPKERVFYLSKAAQIFDLVQLEYAHDLTPAILQNIPKEKRWLVWKGAVNSVTELEQVFEKMRATEAAYYQLITVPEHAADTLIPLQFLQQQHHQNVIAFADGLLGLWTQIVALHFGSSWIFGKPDRKTPLTAFTVEQLIEDYNLPTLHPFKALYGIVGNPVITSGSPRLHNAAYRYLDMEALYLPFNVSSFEDFWEGLLQNERMNELGLPIKGLTTVSPFKEKGVQLADVVDSPLIAASSASNLLVKHKDKWVAQTTDSTGVIQALKTRQVTIKEKKIAVIGCGGAGRTIAYALRQAGAVVTLINRSLEKGQFAANLLGLPFVSLDEFTPQDFEVIINATPIGKKHEKIPFDIKGLHESTILIDMIYNDPPTPLTEQSQKLGLETITGHEILKIQVKNQFLGMTGRPMPDVLFGIS